MVDKNKRRIKVKWDRMKSDLIGFCKWSFLFTVVPLVLGWLALLLLGVELVFEGTMPDTVEIISVMWFLGAFFLCAIIIVIEIIRRWFEYADGE